MTDIAIRVENLSKLYRIGARQERYYTLRDTLASAFTAPLRALATTVRRPLTAASSPDGRQPSAAGGRDSYIWALKDVSFEVKRGEVVGIIGRNGAGKTTLLKILSRITEPTEGRAEVYGRVGSLLEVGTGFHPELTGRENIYLNGAILGMKKAEIDRKFDEIVAFAEIEKFIDTPVKRYSSGMYVRLAFAVAAHLEPEILLVDEVLAVGDIEFQRKCLGKMSEIGAEGRTVLFVSHNVSVIRRLCQIGMLLDEGRVVAWGPMRDVIEQYTLAYSSSSSLQEHLSGVLFDKERTNYFSGDCEVVRMEMLDEKGQPLAKLHTWDNVRFRVHYRSKVSIPRAGMWMEFYTIDGIRIIRCSTGLVGASVNLRPSGGYVDFIIPSFPLTKGVYRIGVGMAVPFKAFLWRDDNIALVEVEGNDVHGGGRVLRATDVLIVIPFQCEVSEK